MAAPHHNYVPLEGTELPLVAAGKKTKVSERAALLTARAVEERIDVTVVVRPTPEQNWRGLRDKMLAQASPNPYRLGDEECLRAFSADPAELERVANVLKDFDLEITKTDAKTRSVHVRGTLAALSNAFRVEFAMYDDDGQVHRGYEGQIHIPAEIADVVEYVFGLDDFPIVKRTFTNGSPATFKYPPPKYTIKEMATLYRFPQQAQAKGQTVGIVVLGGGYHQSDIDEYFEDAGLHPPQISTVGQNNPASRKILRYLINQNTEKGCPSEENPEGDPPPPLSEEEQAQVAWTFETTMDIQILGTLANQAHLVVYLMGGLDTRSVILGLLEIITGTEAYRPTILSGSWGFGENAGLPRSVLQFLDETVFQGLAALGVTLCFSAGDDGSTNGTKDPAKLEAVFPASSPYVLACGGTSLDAKDGAIVKETVWNSVGATGGGVSQVFSRSPSWQRSARVKKKTARAGRGLPDVAGNADPLTGCKLVLGGCEFISNGTSAVAPLWAALFARIYEALGTSLGWINPLLYQPEVALALNDITEGDNIPKDTPNINQYKALQGWDACTGWGTPNGEQLLTTLKKAVLGDGGGGTPVHRKLVVADLGKSTPKRIKQAREGRGKLLKQVNKVVLDLQDTGAAEPGSTIVVIVEKRSKQQRFPWLP